MPERRTASPFPPTAMKRMPSRGWVRNTVSTMNSTITIQTGAGMPAYLRVPMNVSCVRPGMVYPPATTSARPEVTDSVAIVTMNGLNPRSVISPLATPTITPTTSATAMASHTGLLPLTSLPQMTPARAAVPGIEISMAPAITPTATPAANTAVRAAAFAIRTALLHCAKYGSAQREKAMTSRMNSTNRPRLRAKIRPLIARESLVCSPGAAPAVASSADEATAPWGCAGTVIRIAAWRPRSSGRGGDAASPPLQCRWQSLVCSHVPVPAAPVARPGGGAAGPLRPRPVRVEPGRRAARALAAGASGRAGLPGAVPAAHRRAAGPFVAGRRLPDGAAAGAAGLRPGGDRVLQPGEPGPAAGLAQGRAGRGLPDRRAARQAVGGAPPVPL